MSSRLLEIQTRIYNLLASWLPESNASGAEPAAPAQTILENQNRMYDLLAARFAQMPDEIADAVLQYLEDHPEALNQAAVEAILDGRLDGIEADVGGLKSAISELEEGSLSALGAANNQVPTAHGDGTWSWQNQQGGGGGDTASAEPHNYAKDGTDLSTVFADADALWAALAQENYANIHVGDYWPVTLNGDYWDYGGNTIPAGTTYYSDTACTAEAGETAQTYATSAINDTAVPGGAKDYVEFKIGSTTYYAKIADTLPYQVRTLSSAIMYFEAMPNVYWRYGDSGAQNFHNGCPHILFAARDGLPHTLKMRKGNEIWENTHIAEFTGDGSTMEFTIDGTVGTIGYVFVDGVRKAYNTDYTFGSGKITFKANKQPASDALLQVEWMEAKTPWTGSALYRTFNDPDHGIIKLIQQADAKLYAHIYQGPNGEGMRYHGEIRTKTNQQGGGWEDRGVLFLPTEDEIWGRPIHSASGMPGYAQMQQWPIYQLGGRRHFAKGAGNAASRNYVWCASSTSVTNFSYVNNYGYPSSSVASGAAVAAPCFIFCEAPA